MLLDTNQNLISSFNANTDLSILTIDAEPDADNRYKFNVNLFNVRATIKLNQSILDSLTTVDSNNEKVYPVLKTQCIFQNQSTFNSKFENEIFSKTSNLNSYTPDANIYIEKFPQYEILNKYYKSNQTSDHTNIENETIVSTQDVDFTQNSEAGNGLGYYDPDTYEYTHVINTTDSKLFLNLDYVSVRILILDDKDNIIGDSLTQINTKSILELASQRITVDEMLFIKENFVDNIEDIIDFDVDNTNNPNLYNLNVGANPNIFEDISNTFDIEINGIISYINDFSTNAFPFSLTYFNGSFQSETVDDESETDGGERSNDPPFTDGQEFEFDDAVIQDFHKSLVQHLFLSGKTDIKYEITGSLRFLRKEDESGTRRPSDLSWSFTKEEDMTSLLSSNIFSNDDDSIATFAINNIFNNIQITNKISKNAEDGDFFLEVKAASQIPEIEVSGDRKTFKERTILESILIDTRSVSSLFPSLQRLEGSEYILGEVTPEEFLSENQKLLSLEKLFDEQSIFFSESDNSVLEGSDYINRITFKYSHYYNNQKFSLDYIVNNKNDKSTTFLDRINNYNQIFEEQNVVNLNFENLIKIAIDINNNNQDNRPVFQNGRLPILGTQFEIERQRATTFAEEHRQSRISCFKVADFEIDRARFNNEILDDYDYLGYIDPEDLYGNIYVLLSANRQLTVRKFSEVFGSYSDTNTGYYKLQNNFFRNLDADVASSRLFRSPLRSFTSYLDIAYGPNQNSTKTIKDLILSDRMPEVKRGLSLLESKDYNLKLNIFVFPKDINDLLDEGLVIGSEDELTLFPDKEGEELDTATSAAHSFINTISLNHPEQEHFRQLFTSGRTNSNIEYYKFIKSFLPNVFDISRPTIRFSFRQGSSESQLQGINSKSRFLSLLPSDLAVVSATESDVSVSESTRIQVNELESEGNYLDETNNPAEDLLINTENLRMDLVPEYRVYEDFYNLQKVNTEIFIEKNPFNVSFEGAVDIGNRSSEIKTQKVNKVIIYNEISSESKIKIDITALKRSFDIYGNIAESDIFVRASLFPLFTTPSDFLSHYREENLISAGYNRTSHQHSWYSKKYFDGNDEIDYYGDTTNRDDKEPLSSSLTNYEGKKYFSYQRFYSKDHTGEIGQDNIKFGFVENYIPQSYIVQERILSRDYLTIDINSNSVNLLDSLDFSDLASDAIGVFVKDECMLKDIVLRISVSIKVFGGSIPQYTTLYLNSIVSRQNLLNDKIIFNNNSTGTGSDSVGSNAVPVTEIVTRQIRRDY